MNIIPIIQTVGSAIQVVDPKLVAEAAHATYQIGKTIFSFCVLVGASRVTKIAFQSMSLFLLSLGVADSASRGLAKEKRNADFLSTNLGAFRLMRLAFLTTQQYQEDVSNDRDSFDSYDEHDSLLSNAPDRETFCLHLDDALESMPSHARRVYERMLKVIDKPYTFLELAHRVTMFVYSVLASLSTFQVSGFLRPGIAASKLVSASLGLMGGYSLMGIIYDTFRLVRAIKSHREHDLLMKEHLQEMDKLEHLLEVVLKIENTSDEKWNLVLNELQNIVTYDSSEIHGKNELLTLIDNTKDEIKNLIQAEKVAKAHEVANIKGAVLGIIAYSITLIASAACLAGSPFGGAIALVIIGTTLQILRDLYQDFNDKKLNSHSEYFVVAILEHYIKSITNIASWIQAKGYASVNYLLGNSSISNTKFNDGELLLKNM